MATVIATVEMAICAAIGPTHRSAYFEPIDSAVGATVLTAIVSTVVSTE